MAVDVRAGRALPSRDPHEVRFGSAVRNADDTGMSEDPSQLWNLARGVVLLCPPLWGLVLLAVVSRVVPARAHLVYWTLGLSALTFVCWRIVRAHPHPGPDPTVLTSGLFAQAGTLLSLALAGVVLYRWARTGSPLGEQLPPESA